MNHTEFWKMIALAKEDTDSNPDGMVIEIEEALLKLSEKEVLDFTHILQQLLAESYTASLWGAAYLINCTEDPQSFEAFRAWLILQGKDAFYELQENPDLFHELIEPEDVDQDFKLENYELLQTPFIVWSELTDREPEEMPLERDEVELEGEFRFDEVWLEEEYPMLWQKVG